MSSFDLIAARHNKDTELPNAERAHAIKLRLSLLNGTFYEKQPYPFHQEFAGKRFITIHDRKPNVPSGTNELKIQVQRQASMVYGDNRFPQVYTSNEKVRRVLEDFVSESQIVDREREAVVIGSTGSVARHLRVLAPPGEPARLFVDVYATSADLTTAIARVDDASMVGTLKTAKGLLGSITESAATAVQFIDAVTSVKTEIDARVASASAVIKNIGSLGGISDTADAISNLRALKSATRDVAGLGVTASYLGRALNNAKKGMGF